MHAASVPGFITSWALRDSVEMTAGGPPEPKTTADVLAAHDEGAVRAKDALATIGDAGLGAMWTMKTPDGKTIMTRPKEALVRSVALNHLYHHCGRLSAYLRLLDVPVPSIYGPTADERPGFSSQFVARGKSARKG
jgi:uncharacterized damage-inducible protein DinB